MTEHHGDWQNTVYLQGLSGEPPAFPVDWGELEAQAAAKVEPVSYTHLTLPTTPYV